jgi:4-hydroxybenzoate polyprenyltransferase
MTTRQPARPRSSRLVRFAIAFWLALAVVIWNAVFDREIDAAQVRYVQMQAEHSQGRGPAVTIPGVMDAAIRHGLWLASGWALALAGTGLALTLVTARVARKRGG